MKEYSLYKEWCGLLLILYSVMAAAVIAERLWSRWRLRKATKAMETKVAGLLQAPTREAFAAAFAGSPAPLALAMNYVFKQGVLGSPETTLLMLDDGLERGAQLYKKNLAYIAALAGTAPFVGLLGTVLGIIKTFAAIAKEGFGGPAVVSFGISQALQATAVGLAVAIPCFIAYNLFLSATNTAMGEVRMQANRILVALGDL